MNIQSIIALLILSYVSLGISTTDFFSSDTLSNLFRSKKKVLVRKSSRGQGRYTGRQSSNFQHSSTVSSPGVDYSYSYSSSDNPNSIAWKPIIHPISSENNYKYAEVKSIPNGLSGHMQTNNKERRVILLDKPLSARDGESAPTNGYALLHYYIPFDQLLPSKVKPIEEQLADTPHRPLTIEEIMKASIEPVAVFQTTTTPKPSTTSHVTSILADHDGITEIKEPDGSGKYEYEYVVQDNHFGTNFGHKEIRDGKFTKGDYEVVLPDGRVQHVKYWSDDSGYHATVTYHPVDKKFKYYKH